MSICGLTTWVKKLIITIILEVPCIYPLVTPLPLQVITSPFYILIIHLGPLPPTCNLSHLPYVRF